MLNLIVAAEYALSLQSKIEHFTNLFSINNSNQQLNCCDL